MSDRLQHLAPRLRRRRSPCSALGRKPRCAQGFAGLGEDADGFAAVVPGKAFCLSRRSRPASGFPHRVVVRHGEPDGSQRRRLWRAVDAVPAGDARRARSSEGWANQQIWMGHAAVTRADTHRYAAKPLRAAASARPASRPSRFRPGSMPGRCAALDGDARHDRRAARAQRRRAPISAMRCGSTPTGRWCCRATAATAANRSAARRRIITASLISRRPAASPSTTSRSRSPARPGWTANGAASRWRRTRPDGTGSRCIWTPARN